MVGYDLTTNKPTRDGFYWVKAGSSAMSAVGMARIHVLDNGDIYGDIFDLYGCGELDSLNVKFFPSSIIWYYSEKIQDAR